MGTPSRAEPQGRRQSSRGLLSCLRPCRQWHTNAVNPLNWRHWMPRKFETPEGGLHYRDHLPLNPPPWLKGIKVSQRLKTIAQEVTEATGLKRERNSLCFLPCLLFKSAFFLEFSSANREFEMGVNGVEWHPPHSTRRSSRSRLPSGDLARLIAKSKKRRGASQCPGSQRDQIADTDCQKRVPTRPQGGFRAGRLATFMQRLRI